MSFPIRKIFFIATLVILYSCERENTAVVKFKVENGKGSQIIIFEQHVSGQKAIDSLKVNIFGTARTNIRVRRTKFYNVKVDDDNSISLILSPGDLVNISYDLNEFKKTKSIAGSESSILLNRLYDSLTIIRPLIKELSEQYELAETDPKKDSLEKEYMKIRNDYRRFTTDLILKNTNSLVSLAALYQELAPDNFVLNQIRDMQLYKIVSDSLTKYYPENRHVQALKSNYNNMYSQYIQQRLLSNKDINIITMPDLELPDRDGKIRRISDQKGKYVLVHFWATWNKNSVNLMQDYKRIHDQFRSKGFEIYNVSFDKSLKDWKYAIDFEEINHWVNVCDTTFPNSNTITKFNITTLPGNYLLNADQTEIIGKNLSPTDLRRKLSIIIK